MLYSFSTAVEQNIPEAAKQHIRAAQIFGGAEGFVLGPEALHQFLANTHAGNDIPSLIEHAQDEESISRVDQQVHARIVTGKIPDDVAQHIVEAVEVLGMHTDNVSSSDVPLVCVLYTDAEVKQTPIIINVVGKKSLADTVRELWARVFVSPYPPLDVNAAILMYRMPPVEQCVHITITDKTHLYAVHGWGLAVGDEEIADKYVLGPDTTSFEEHHVHTQDMSVYRNPRTGEVVRSRPAHSAIQKVPDDQLRRIASLAKRAGMQEAYVGVFGEHLRVLRIASASESAVEIDGVDVEQTGYEERAPEPDETLDEIVGPPHDEVESFEQVPPPEQEAVEEEVEVEHSEPEAVADQAPLPSAKQLLEDDDEHVEEPVSSEPEPAPAEQTSAPFDGDAFDQAVHEVEQSAASAVQEIEQAVEELTEAISQEQEEIEAEEQAIEDIVIEDAEDAQIDEFEHEEIAEEYEEQPEEVYEEEVEEDMPEPDHSEQSSDDDPSLPPFEDFEEEAEELVAEAHHEPEAVHGEQDPEPNDAEVETADSVHAETIELAGHVIEYTLFTIELALRESLNDHGPEEFSALLEHVAHISDVPCKSDIEALQEMRVNGTASHPNPEQVAHALRTLEQFRSEF